MSATPTSPPSARDLRALLRLAEHTGPVTLADAQDAACLATETLAARWVRRMVSRGALREARGGYRVEVPRGCLPPVERKASQAAPITLGERGRWKLPRSSKGPWAALGPVLEVWDGAGRRYSAQWAIARPGVVAASHDAAGVKVKNYPAELQARDRGGALSRLQVEALARELDAARWVAPSSSVVDSSPIVVQWGDVWAVASGNGRVAALARRSKDDPGFRRVLAETAARRWRLPPEAVAAIEGGAIPVRVVDAPPEVARELAGASQSVDAGALQKGEAARSKARGAGLRMQDMPGIRFFRALDNEANVAAFEAANPAFTAAALSKVPAQLRASMPPQGRAEIYAGIMFASLPAPWADLQRGPVAEALWASLPGLWTLAGDVRDGARAPEYDLLPHLGAALGVVERLRAVPARKLAAELAQGARQTEIGEASGEGEAPRDLAGLLGALILRASRRDDPGAAVAEWLEAYHAEAPDPRQIGFLPPAAPVEILAGVLGIRRNPAPCMCDLAVRWHWGRYRKARRIQGRRLPWQPARGFALGTLVYIQIGKVGYELPESAGVLLCATGEGHAELFTVPPIEAPAEGPIRALHYVTTKGKDKAPVRYEHDDIAAPYPQARARGREKALEIQTRGAAMYLDPERGLVN